VCYDCSVCLDCAMSFFRAILSVLDSVVQAVIYSNRFSDWDEVVTRELCPRFAACAYSERIRTAFGLGLYSDCIWTNTIIIIKG